MVSVLYKELCKQINIKLIFRNNTSVCSSCHSRKHCSKPCISSEYFQYKKSLMRSCRCPQAVGHLNCPGNTGAEADAIISSRDIIIHCFRDCHNIYSFFITGELHSSEYHRHRLGSDNRHQAIRGFLSLPESGRSFQHYMCPANVQEHLFLTYGLVLYAMYAEMYPRYGQPCLLHHL